MYCGQLGPCSYLRLRLATFQPSTSIAASTPLTGPLFNPDTLLRDALASAEDADSYYNPSSSRHKAHNRYTLLEGAGGAGALTAILLFRTGRIYESGALTSRLLSDLTRSVKIAATRDCEVLYGRAGALQVILFLRKWGENPNVGSDLAKTIIHMILKEGMSYAAVTQRDKSVATTLPLLWQWHDRPYLGAAHGVVGILHTLLHFTREVGELGSMAQIDYMRLIKETIDGLNDHCAPGGNLKSRPGRDRRERGEELVHWCHGAPGHALLLVKASEVFDNESYLEAAEDLARNVIFPRGVLRKGVGLCHGISGNGYVFLALHRARMKREGEYDGVWLDMARHFADIAVNKYHDLENVPDRPYSLYEGAAGLVVFLMDLLNPEKSHFPCYEA